MYSKILCAVDGSETSRKTAEVAAGLAALYSSELTLLNVIPTPVLQLLRYRQTMLDDDLLQPQVEQRLTEHAQAILNKAQELFPTAATEQRLGHPGETICECAAEGGHDLLVVGSHGRGGKGRKLMGSISAYLVRHSPIPVMVVKS